jgi:hypothetical protein
LLTQSDCRNTRAGRQYEGTTGKLCFLIIILNMIVLHLSPNNSQAMESGKYTAATTSRACCDAFSSAGLLI